MTAVDKRRAVLERRYAVRRQGLSTGTTTVGTAIFHTVSRNVAERDFDVHLLRMREIEALIVHRHGPTGIPDPAGTDDRETCLDYARAIAAALSGHDLHAWARRWCPWALDAEIEMIARSVGWRKYILGAKRCAEMLHVQLAERDALGLKTIRACDVSDAAMKVMAANAKRERDREREERKRRASGAVPRSEYEAGSLEATRPWRAAGISRRTWYRRRGTGASLVDIDNTIGEGLVPPAGRSVFAPDGATHTPGKSQASVASTPKAEHGLAGGAHTFVGADPHRSREPVATEKAA